MNAKLEQDQLNAFRVFEAAAELFSVLSTPIRLKILSVLCDKELSVSQILEQVQTTQPNMSQHLALLYRHGVIAKRKEGTQVMYSVKSQRAASLCRTVCMQIAIDLGNDPEVQSSDRLLVNRF